MSIEFIMSSTYSYKPVSSANKGENKLDERLKNPLLNKEDRKVIEEYIKASNGSKKTKKELVLARIKENIQAKFNARTLEEIDEKECRTSALSYTAEAAGIPKTEIDIAEGEVAKRYLAQYPELDKLITNYQNINDEASKKAVLNKITSLLIENQDTLKLNKTAQAVLKVTALMEAAEAFGISGETTLSDYLKNLIPDLKTHEYVLLTKLWLSLETPEKSDEAEIEEIILKYLKERKTETERSPLEEKILSLNNFTFTFIGIDISVSLNNNVQPDKTFCSSALTVAYPELEEEDKNLFLEYFIAEKSVSDQTNMIAKKITERYDEINKKRIEYLTVEKGDCKVPSYKKQIDRALAFRSVASHLGIILNK